MISINKIVIVGGGSSGWITASTISKFYPKIDLTLIESANVPTIGVGESTQASVTSWMNMLEIDHNEMLKETDGSFKLGIRFKNFYKNNDESFFYPFGKGKFEDYACEVDAVTLWNFKKQIYKNIKSSDYCESFYSQMPFINLNKIPDQSYSGFNLKTDVAFHFDAIKLAKYLKNKICIPNGINHVLGDIESVNKSEAGIESIILDNGEKIEADLFIDCTGFNSLLIEKELNEPYESFEDVLPVNKAWAVQIPYADKESEMVNYTDSTALSSGWVWAIPLWSRIGTGYVYSDKFISPEDALEEFKEHLREVRGAERVTDELQFRDISFRSGVRSRAWVKNVVAVGLSAGFIEPLESNGLHTTIELALKLIKIINRGFVNQWDIDSFNYITKHTIIGFREFVQAHYFLSSRTDTDFWKHVTSINPGGDLFEERIDQTNLKSLVFDKTSPFGSFSTAPNTGWHCIAAGMEYTSVGMDSISLYKIFLDKDIEDIVKNFISNNYKDRAEWNLYAQNSMSHLEFLSKKVHNV